ncbi:carboxyl-terminal protease [Synergistes jonesii]|uniref:Carboxyl-terminal protease n=1 Tax=Synergistes jonesii TaxID=2754 RepID=A0A073IMH1_9BACT|nr:S41 family peptidase [Synergistes jonesii]KEJ91503.1 carboxyl-terminal protease [Synergistes jonesii]OFB60554.1 carboxyl-terminal protease [Synergistes jonesii]OFB61310.1 carboxyl-terminal protease [Synergistes jonesii]OFB64905.1 carboxyl-terminal protease [Synergistes jonesii]OFB66731.1 carboxyl-terminal protease [Synergistes jonesii]
MKSKILSFAAGAIAGAVICAGTGALSQATGAEWEKSLPFTPQQLAVIKQVKLALSTYQVDGDKKGKIDDTKMYYGALKGLVASLEDPYTRFVDPKDLAEENVEMEGEYGGLGIYIASREGRTTIIAPIEDTPADRAGVKPLDEIVKVDDKNVWGMESDEIVKLLRGPAGKPVTLQIRRKNVNKLIPVKMVREIIKIKTVRSEMLDGGIAYIKLNHFNLKSDGEVRAALENAKKKNAKGVIMDLRNNPGGLLDVCVDVTSQFIPKGVVVGMRGRFEKANETLYAKEGRANKLPLVVLINEGSASAAEIFAGAVKDHKRGTVVGAKTFGKGSVQTLFNLPDGSGIYVTIARYNTPSGFVLDHKGLQPDVAVAGEPKKNKKEDKQLQKAIGIMKQKLKAK